MIYHTYVNVSITMLTKFEQVRQIFEEHGISIAEWARRNGFSVPLAYQILSGNKKCLRGQSHAIAVALGLKEGKEPDFSSLSHSLREVAETENDAGSGTDTE